MDVWKLGLVIVLAAACGDKEKAAREAEWAQEQARKAEKEAADEKARVDAFLADAPRDLGEADSRLGVASAYIHANEHLDDAEKHLEAVTTILSKYGREGLEPDGIGEVRARHLELSLALGDIQAAASTSRTAPEPRWRYSSHETAMGVETWLASTRSTNTISFGFPYTGDQHAKLTVRRAKSKDVILDIEQGQFLCSMGCRVNVRFDDDKAMRWSAVGPADHGTTTLFLRNASKFIKSLASAERLRIEADFYQEGTRVLDFDVVGFDPKGGSDD